MNPLFTVILEVPELSNIVNDICGKTQNKITIFGGVLYDDFLVQKSFIVVVLCPMLFGVFRVHSLRKWTDLLKFSKYKFLELGSFDHPARQTPNQRQQS